jgi:hypothetical protein
MKLGKGVIMLFETQKGVIMPLALTNKETYDYISGN